MISRGSIEFEQLTDLSIIDLIRSLMKRWQLVLICCITFSAIGYFIAAVWPKQYETKILIKPAQLVSVTMKQLKAGQIELITSSITKLSSTEFNRKLADGLGFPVFFAAEEPRGSGLLLLRMRAGSRERLLKAANAATNLVRELHQEAFEAGLESLRDELRMVQQEAASTRRMLGNLTAIIDRTGGKNASELPALLQLQLEYSKRLSEINNHEHLLNLAMAPYNSHPTKVEYMTQIPENPIIPNYGLSVFLGCLFGFLVALYIVVFRSSTSDKDNPID